MNALTEFTSEQIETLLRYSVRDSRRASFEIVEILEEVVTNVHASKDTKRMALKQYEERKKIADVLMLWEVQLRNALKIVKEQENILNT